MRSEDKKYVIMCDRCGKEKTGNWSDFLPKGWIDLHGGLGGVGFQGRLYYHPFFGQFCSMTCFAEAFKEAYNEAQETDRK